jgi:hypothetical protein
VQEPHSFSEFWPFYVLVHQHSLTRAFHFPGMLIGWSLLIVAGVHARRWLIVAAVLVPYGLAWIAHFFVEHNRLASFGHPL